VSGYVKAMAEALFIMFAVFFPFKVFNLHLIDGVLRSGADTRYGMFLDILGVWGIGVPLAYLSGIVLKLDLPIVYLIISSEEVCKCILGARRFISKKWIHNVVKNIE
jgi:Na+-driven multidrug efflux pump